MDVKEEGMEGMEGMDLGEDELIQLARNSNIWNVKHSTNGKNDNANHSKRTSSDSNGTFPKSKRSRHEVHGFIVIFL